MLDVAELLKELDLIKDCLTRGISYGSTEPEGLPQTEIDARLRRASYHLGRATARVQAAAGPQPAAGGTGHA